MRTHGGRRGWVAAVAALAVTAAACGGGSGGEETAGTVDANVKEGVNAALSGGSTTVVAGATTTTVKEPTSIEEWEKLWAEERAAMVKRIKDNKWGKSADGKSVAGPEGFKIDLSKCTTGWSDTEGITDTEIKLGSVSPLSGTAADFGNLDKTKNAWFKYYSEKGLLKDSNGKTRKINFIFKDDAYDATRTIPLVDEMLTSDKVFALMAVGTPAGLKIYDKINQNCVPHPMHISGSPAWGDPVNRPWTVGGLFAYNTEAQIWGSFIDKNIAELTKDGGKVRVASLVASSDFGAAYESSFKSVIAASPNKDKIEFFVERLEITSPTITDAMTNLNAKNPNVFITMTGATHCPQIINEVVQNGMDKKLKFKFMSSVCKSSAYVGKDKVGGDGSQSDGWLIVGGGQKDINVASGQGDAFAKWGVEFLSKNGLDSKSSSQLGNGFYPAWVMTQALIVGGELPGGLTRSNFITALRAFEGTSPVHLKGIKINMNGNKDAYLLEGSDLSKYDAKGQTWVVQGDIIELSGKTSNCVWNPSAMSCG
jgi:branched-chain amino acid transport system substrate-binding protein